jgi:hypothetical protein
MRCLGEHGYGPISVSIIFFLETAATTGQTSGCASLTSVSRVFGATDWELIMDFQEFAGSRRRFCDKAQPPSEWCGRYHVAGQLEAAHLV